MSRPQEGQLPKKYLLRGLYAITDSALIPSARLGDQVEQALRGGATVIQYRDKSDDKIRREREVQVLLKLCRTHRVPLIINDDIELAQRSGADGVHLGCEDETIAHARERLGVEAVIGVSCYNSLERALSAEAAGADYIALGAFFASRTKPDAVTASVDLLRESKARLKIPVAAIGGIDPEEGAILVEAGADMLAVVHGVFAQPDSFAAAQNYARLFE